MPRVTHRQRNRRSSRNTVLYPSRVPWVLRWLDESFAPNRWVEIGRSSTEHVGHWPKEIRLTVEEVVVSMIAFNRSDKCQVS